MDFEILTTAHMLSTMLFYIVTLLFTIFSVASVYHWFTYGSSKSVSTLSLAVYLIVAAPLFIVMSIALSLMNL
jgi:NADH:ubiquinone oxidoreductase subunit 3 (subunit A)